MTLTLCNELAPDEHALYAALSARMNHSQPSRSNVTLDRAAEVLGLPPQDVRTVFSGLVDAGFAVLDGYGRAELRNPPCECGFAYIRNARTRTATTSLPTVGWGSPLRGGVVGLPSGDLPPRTPAGRTAEHQDPYDLRRVQATTRARTPQRPTRRRRVRPDDVEAWSTRDLVAYFAEKVNSATHFGMGVGETNGKALGGWITKWRRSMSNAQIKEMIDVFASDKRYVERGKPGWKSFINQRHKLAEAAGRRVEVDAVPDVSEYV